MQKRIKDFQQKEEAKRRSTSTSTCTSRNSKRRNTKRRTTIKQKCHYFTSEKSFYHATFFFLFISFSFISFTCNSTSSWFHFIKIRSFHCVYHVHSSYTFSNSCSFRYHFQLLTKNSMDQFDEDSHDVLELDTTICVTNSSAENGSVENILSNTVKIIQDKCSVLYFSFKFIKITKPSRW